MACEPVFESRRDAGDTGAAKIGWGSPSQQDALYLQCGHSQRLRTGSNGCKQLSHSIMWSRYCAPPTPPAYDTAVRIMTT